MADEEMYATFDFWVPGTNPLAGLATRLNQVPQEQIVVSVSPIEAQLQGEFGFYWLVVTKEIKRGK